MITLLLVCAVAVTLGVWIYDAVLHSPQVRKVVRENRAAMALDPRHAGMTSAQLDRVQEAARQVWAAGHGIVVGLAVFGLAAIVGAFPAGAEEPQACMSASLQMAFTRGPGIQVHRITREGVNLAAVVEAFMANAGAPDLGTDDFILTVDAEAVTVTPVRAGLVCRNFTRLAFPLASGGQALLKAVELAEMGAGRA